VFVPVAEQSGQVGALGAFVRRAAFRDTAAIASRLGSDLVVSVNASGYELVDPGCAGELLDALADAGLTPAVLVVEVTESVVEGGSARALQTLSQLRDHGVAVAVDDFGAGYSTLSRLDEVPADFIKLDGALLDGATASPRRRALLEAAIGVGDALGLPVVAEGVETAEQAALLLELGCTRAQGFYFCRPLPAEALLAHCGRDDDGRLTTRPTPAAAERAAVS
jgi:EAL domain-containing protein (putative c-di-GMP-specific phosphodiesterase class I)